MNNFALDSDEIGYFKVGSLVLEYVRDSTLTSPLDFVSHVASFTSSLKEAQTVYHTIIDAWSQSVHPRKKVRRDLPGTSSYTFDFHNDKDSEGARVFVYSSLIESSLCSDFRGKCLRILSFEKDTRHQSFFPVYYFPLERNTIDVVEIELKTKYNEYFPFPDSPHPVVLVIEFRRVQ